jgi:Uri superfamily endonuclease
MDLSGKGVYCLLFEKQACNFEVGKKGEFSFSSGFHIYVGSALGGGGLKRVQRHINLSRNKDKKPKWHVDYIHLNPSFKLISAVCAFTSSKFECELAKELAGKIHSKSRGDFVRGFGCTDCKCDSHLFCRKENPVFEVIEAFKALGLYPFLIQA